MDDETRLEKMENPEPAGQPPSEQVSAEQRLRRTLQLEQDDLVVFGEDGQFHLVQKATYTAHELPDSLVSTAEYLVGLGAVVADVNAFNWEISWQQLTDGCSCIVLNLAAIRQISEKKDKPITFIHTPDGRGPRAGRKHEHLTGEHHADKETSRAAPMEARKSEPHPRLDPDDLVIFNEDRKFYWVKKDDYLSESSELHKEMRSAPELMVMLGVVVADIPRIPTAGTACFLLNLDSVRHGSSHAAQLLAENLQASRFPEQQAKERRDTLDAERKQEDAALGEKKGKAEERLKKWIAETEKIEKDNQKLPARDFQKKIAQRLRVIDSIRAPLVTKEKSLQARLASQAGPEKGERRLNTASGRSKRAPGKRTSTARGTPRGRKK